MAAAAAAPARWTHSLHIIRRVTGERGHPTSKRGPRTWWGWLRDGKRPKKKPQAPETSWADILTGSVGRALAGSGTQEQQGEIDPEELEERARSLEALADMLRTWATPLPALAHCLVELLAR